MFKHSFQLFAATIILASCSSLKKSQKNYNVNLPEVNVSSNFNEYKAARKIVNDLLHTKLEVDFDWKNKYLNGKAALTFKPHFHSVDVLELDAQGFDIKSTNLLKADSTLLELDYKYDEKILTLSLDKTYARTDTYTVIIEYTAKPDELEEGGNSAIRSEKGLYFINPDGANKYKPKQIWTQGETQASSCWFPTIDAPNEKTTQEIYITVDEKYTTLSNGELIYSSFNQDGTRTDYWKQDLPHAPYLFMMAIGEYAIIKDEWKDIPVDYYVEKDYKDDAMNIFGETPDMITFFSEKFGVEYPWAKYSQIIVRDYVSGAMENTSAVIHGEFVQRTTRQLIDRDNHSIIAHELGHHWFGDLITCESWANLPLNESFATYSSYLWDEHRYGKDIADEGMFSNMSRYFRESRYKKEPIIRYYYGYPLDMFDRHSYQKGSAILHMLRNYLGGEAFFASIQNFLTKNAFKAVESDHLRLAFEETTGEDLHWFFDQWFDRAGHPTLDISYNYKPESVEVTIKQTQPEATFQFPLSIDLYFTDTIIRHKEWVTESEEKFEYNITEKPKLVNVDPEKVLLCEKEDHKSSEAFLYQFYNAPHLFDRIEAFDYVEDLKNPDEAEKKLLYDALKDPSSLIRINAISEADLSFQDTKEAMIKMVDKDDASNVRAKVISFLSDADSSEQFRAIFLKALSDSSYYVNSVALRAMYEVDSIYALEKAKKWENSIDNNVIYAIASIYSQEGRTNDTAFYLAQIEKARGERDIASMVPFYINHLGNSSDDVFYQHIKKIQKIGTDAEEVVLVNRINKSLNDLSEDLKSQRPSLKASIKKLKKEDPIKMQETQAKLDALEAKINSIEIVLESLKEDEAED